MLGLLEWNEPYNIISGIVISVAINVCRLCAALNSLWTHRLVVYTHQKRLLGLICSVKVCVCVCGAEWTAPPHTHWISGSDPDREHI